MKTILAALCASAGLAVTPAGAVEPFPEPMVSLAFDDSAGSGYSLAAPLLARHGFRATYYLITRSLDAPDRVTFAQARELGAQGHEIASHTVSHPLLTSLSIPELRRELSRSQDRLVAEVGVPDVLSFAAPWGQTDARVLEEIRKFYTSNRTASGYRNFRDADPFSLGAYALDGRSSASFVRMLVDRAVSERSWLILVFHLLVEGPSGSGTYDVAEFASLLDDLAARGVKVVTVSEGVALMNPPRRCGAPHRHARGEPAADPDRRSAR